MSCYKQPNTWEKYRNSLPLKVISRRINLYIIRTHSSKECLQNSGESFPSLFISLSFIIQTSGWFRHYWGRYSRIYRYCPISLWSVTTLWGRGYESKPSCRNTRFTRIFSCKGLVLRGGSLSILSNQWRLFLITPEQGREIHIIVQSLKSCLVH